MPFSRITTCPICGTKNRISAAHLADEGRCGACKARLAPAAEPLDTDASVFDDVIREARVPVLVDFWAPWCGPCRSAASQVHDLAHEMAGRALVLKVNTDANQEVAARYRIQSIPNFLVFRHGKPVMQRVGLAPRSEMRRWLEASATPSESRLEP